MHSIPLVIFAWIAGLNTTLPAYQAPQPTVSNYTVNKCLHEGKDCVGRPYP